MVSNAVKGLLAEIEWDQSDICTPNGVVVSFDEIGAEGILAGVAARPVPAVVPDCNRLCEVDVEAEGASD
jgi:hypothetical protein